MEVIDTFVKGLIEDFWNEIITDVPFTLNDTDLKRFITGSATFSATAENVATAKDYWEKKTAVIKKTIASLKRTYTGQEAT